jgi:hypothetical protein
MPGGCVLPFKCAYHPDERPSATATSPAKDVKCSVLTYWALFAPNTYTHCCLTLRGWTNGGGFLYYKEDRSISGLAQAQRTRDFPARTDSTLCQLF